jgi:P27 family predicted phage terminase small subunit
VGKRGPKPTPTAILNARGSWRGKKNKDEPVMDATAPQCPDWLDAQAKAYWAEIAPMLSEGKVLRRIDRAALARYCQLLARWRRCEEFIAKHGDTYPIKDDAGHVKGVKEFPQVRRASDLSAQLCRLEAEFGMTPSSRSRVVAAAGGGTGAAKGGSNEGEAQKPKSRFFPLGPAIKAG